MEEPLSLLRKENIEALVKEMVSIPSTANKEHAMSDWTYNKLDALGLKVFRLPVEESGDAIVGVLESSGSNPAMSLNFHMDTFDAFLGWRSDPFKPITRNRRIFGLGAHDMKGGGACLLSAVEAIVESGIELGGRLVVSATSDEENWSRGAHAVIKAGYLKECHYNLVPEPSAKGTLTVGGRGRHVFHLTFIGSAVSAAYDDGVNAVVDAARAASALSALSKSELGWNEEYQIGGTLTVIGLKGGGTMIYVPELADVWIDRHILPGQTAEWAADQIHRVVKKVIIKGEYKLTWDERPTPAPTSFIVPKDSHFVKILSEAVSKESGLDIRYVLARSVADTNHFAVYGGLPTIVYGPTGGNTCKANEWVDVDSLTPTSRVYVRSVLGLLGSM